MATYTIRPLFTATAINTGGRNGHSETTDRSVSVDLSVRKEMGGPGRPGTTTPEHLFATGYAARFGALEFVAQQHKKNVSGCVVACDTLVGPRDGGGFGILSGCTSRFRVFLLQRHARSFRRRTTRSAPTAMRREATSTLGSRWKGPNIHLIRRA
jgi:organic hydroperoxide reductase OsmC/OhrA